MCLSLPGKIATAFWRRLVVVETEIALQNSLFFFPPPRVWVKFRRVACFFFTHARHTSHVAAAIPPPPKTTFMVFPSRCRREAVLISPYSLSLSYSRCPSSPPPSSSFFPRFELAIADISRGDLGPKAGPQPQRVYLCLSQSTICDVISGTRQTQSQTIEDRHTTGSPDPRREREWKIKG